MLCHAVLCVFVTVMHFFFFLNLYRTTINTYITDDGNGTGVLINYGTLSVVAWSLRVSCKVINYGTFTVANSANWLIIAPTYPCSFQMIGPLALITGTGTFPALAYRDARTRHA